MSKKGLLVLLLAAIAVGGIFAQEKTADVKKLWVSGEVSLVGAGARGEFMLTPNFSVGLNAYWTSLILWNDLGANVFGRFYPWGKTFYAGLGLGYAIHTGVEPIVVDGEKLDNTGNWLVTRAGFDIVPELGWKLDLGNPGRFFLNPLVQLPLTLGSQEVAGWGTERKGDFGLSVGFRAALGLGWAF
jgi:hypothetical protein